MKKDKTAGKRDGGKRGKKLSGGEELSDTDDTENTDYGMNE
jgi:hypothetical protein